MITSTGSGLARGRFTVADNASKVNLMNRMDETAVPISLEAVIADAHRRYRDKRPRSAEMQLRAREVMPGGNTRSVLAYRPFPTAMASGRGCWLHDVDGNSYLDLCGEYTAGLFGHSNERIIAALEEALGRGLGLSAVGKGEEYLARLICDRFGSIDRVRFTNSGTEANLMAISAARYYTQRSKILVFRGGYHGSVLTFPAAGPSVMTAPYPFLIQEYNDVGRTRDVIRDQGTDIAAVLVEPMLGSGSIAASGEFLEMLRRETQSSGALLIFDEVMTSRMSSGGHQKKLGISPDLTTLGKYIGGGMSFGAFGGKEAVMDLFATELTHAGTFNNNVMSMTAGGVALGELFGSAEADALFGLGEWLRQQLNLLCAKHGSRVHFSGLGSLGSIHFRQDPIAAPYIPTPIEDALRELFFFDMLDSGIYLARRGMHALSLPVTRDDLEKYLHAAGEFLTRRTSLLARLQ